MPGAGDIQQAEGRCGRIALQGAVAQGDGAGHKRHCVVGVVRIGTVEIEREPVQIDHIVRGIGVGAFDGPAQIGHARGVVGTGQGVGEAESGAGIGVVVVDRALTLDVARHRVDDVGDVDEEGFVGFDGGIAIDQHGERRDALAGRNERDDEALRDIVVVGRGGAAIGGGDVEGGAAQRCGCAQADGEDGVGDTAVAFVDADIVDVQRGKGDRRLALVGTDVEVGRIAVTGVGHVRVVPWARIQIQVGEVLHRVAILVDVEEIGERILLVGGIDGGTAGGEAVVARRGDEQGIGVQVATRGRRAGEEAVPRREVAQPGAGVVPQDAVAHLHGVPAFPVQKRALDRVVGDGRVAHFRRRGGGEAHQRTADGGQVVVGEHAAEQSRGTVAPEHGAGAGVAIGEEPVVEGHGHLMAGHCRALGGGIADEIGHHDEHRALRGHRATARGGAVVPEHRVADLRRAAQREDCAAFAAGRTATKLHVAHGERACSVGKHEAERRRGGIALELAVAQLQHAGDEGQGGAAVGVGIGRVAERQDVLIQIDHVIGGIGVGAVDGLAQFGHAGVVVGAGQGVGEAEADAQSAIVVADRALTLGVARHCIADIGDVDEEGFVGLDVGVAVDLHGEHVGAVAGGDALAGQASRGVIARCAGSAVGGGDVEADAAGRCRRAQADGEGEIGRAGIAFVERDIVDAQRWQWRCVVGQREGDARRRRTCRARGDGVRTAWVGVGGGDGPGLFIAVDAGGRGRQDCGRAAGRGAETHLAAQHRFDGLIGGDANHQWVGKLRGDRRALPVTADQRQRETARFEGTDIRRADAADATLISARNVAAGSGAGIDRRAARQQRQGAGSATVVARRADQRVQHVDLIAVDAIGEGGIAFVADEIVARAGIIDHGAGNDVQIGRIITRQQTVAERQGAGKGSHGTNAGLIVRCSDIDQSGRRVLEIEYRTPIMSSEAAVADINRSTVDRDAAAMDFLRSIALKQAVANHHHGTVGSYRAAFPSGVVVHEFDAFDRQ